MGFRWTGFKAPPLPHVNLQTVARDVAVAPVAGLFAVGAAANQLSGGKTTTYNVFRAINGRVNPPTFSVLTQSASGYQGATPKAGKWAAPVLNPATPKAAAQAIKGTTRVARDLTNAAADGLGLPHLGTIVLLAAGGALGLGAVYVATMPKPHR